MEAKDGQEAEEEEEEEVKRCGKWRSSGSVDEDKDGRSQRQEGTNEGCSGDTEFAAWRL